MWHIIVSRCFLCVKILWFSCLFVLAVLSWGLMVVMSNELVNAWHICLFWICCLMLNGTCFSTFTQNFRVAWSFSSCHTIMEIIFGLFFCATTCCLHGHVSILVFGIYLLQFKQPEYESSCCKISSVLSVFPFDDFLLSTVCYSCGQCCYYQLS